MAEPTAETVADDAPAARSGSPMMRLVLAGSFIAVVVLAECAVAWLVFPSADDVARMTAAPAETADDQAPDEAALLPAQPLDGHTEVSLGDFSVSSYQPLSNSTLRIDFQLYSLVKDENVSEVEKLLEQHRHRYREQVLAIVRAAEMTDLADPGLGLIKRQILEKINRTLGKALVSEIIFSDFSFVEQ